MHSARRRRLGSVVRNAPTGGFRPPRKKETSMRAITLTQHGGPEVLTVSEVEDPVPGPG